jgi:hypothetical protein
MIGKGKSISHGVAALEYDLAKEIDGQAAATEIARHELYGCTGAEMVQEMKPYFTDFPNVKNNCLRFEVSPSIEESSSFTDADWAELGNDFMQMTNPKSPQNSPEKIQQELTQKISEICPAEEFIRKSEKEKEDITKEAAMNIVQEAAMRSVWFMISEKYGKFSLILFYDNEYNNAHGEDL